MTKISWFADTGGASRQKGPSMATNRWSEQWTPEARLRQAERIRMQRPWVKAGRKAVKRAAHEALALAMMGFVRA